MLFRSEQTRLHPAGCIGIADVADEKRGEAQDLAQHVVEVVRALLQPVAQVFAR